MNPTKKSPGPRGVPQRVSRQQSQPKLIQRKAASGAPNPKAPVAPPVSRPQPTPRVLQRKASPLESTRTVEAPRQPVAPPVYRPVTKRTVQAKGKTGVPNKVPAGTASARSVVQRQLPPGPYKVVSYATLRDEVTHQEIDQVTINSPVTVLDKGGRISNFKAGWVTNEHSYVEVEERFLTKSHPASAGTAVGWINDERLRSAPVPKPKGGGRGVSVGGGKAVVSAGGRSAVSVREEVEEFDQKAFQDQVDRLYGRFNDGTPGGLSVTKWLQELGGNLSRVQPGTLAYLMCEDAQKSNSLYIVDNERARLADKNWAKLIVEEDIYRRQYPETVRDILKEAPVGIPRKYTSSVRELFFD